MNQPRPGWKLDLNERSEGPPQWAEQALAELPRRFVWQYISPQPLEAELATRLNLEPEQVWVTNGGDEAIQMLIASLGADEPMILPLPSFGFYEQLGRAWDKQIRTVPCQPDLSLDVAVIRQTLQGLKAGLLVLVRPNNPTGEVLDIDVLRDLLELAKKNGHRVLLDEAYIDFYDEGLHGWLQDWDNLLILRTFSKAFGLAGMRIGYLLGQAGALATFRQRGLPYNISAATLHTAHAAFGLQGQADVRKYSNQVANNRDQLRELLRGWGIEVPRSHANFLCLRLGEKRSRFVHWALQQAGCHTRLFGEEGLRDCLRLSIPAEVDSLVELLQLVLLPELLCLDVDGTLIDTSGSFDAVIVAVVSHYTGEEPSEQEILEIRARGGFNDDYELAAALVRERGHDVSQDEVNDLADELYLGTKEQPGLCANETPLVSLTVLQRLAEKLPLALVTGRFEKEMLPVLPMLNLQEETTVYTRDQVTHGKPDPEGIFNAMDDHQAQSAWMVGDNVDDINAARNARAIAIGVGPNREALLKAGAVIVLDHIDELEELL
jgi:histidinol-phosphate aminotransferase